MSDRRISFQEFNDDKTRVVVGGDDVAVLASLVGYEGQVADGEFRGSHAGIFETVDAARAWLSGGEPPSGTHLRIYPER